MVRFRKQSGRRSNRYNAGGVWWGSTQCKRIGSSKWRDDGEVREVVEGNGIVSYGRVEAD